LPTLERLEPTPVSYAVSSDEFKNLPREWSLDIPARNCDFPGVYCLLNLVNGKKYIGSSLRSVKRRVYGHFRNLRDGNHPNRHLTAGWEKHSEKAFRFVLICRCDPSQCRVIEQENIDRFETYKNHKGYNLRRTADSAPGFVMSKQGVEKIRQIQAALNLDEEFCRKRKKRLQDMHANPEFREKFIKAKRKELVEKWKDPAFAESHRKRCSKQMKLLQSDPVFHENNVAKIKRQNADPLFAAKRNAALKKRNDDPEFKKRSSETRRAMNLEPAFREESSRRRKEMNSNPEFKAKIAAFWADPDRVRASMEKRKATILRKKMEAMKCQG